MNKPFAKNFEKKISFFFITVLSTVFIMACEVAVTGSGKGMIDFQPGVWDWQMKTVNLVVDDNMFFIGGFGPTAYQNASSEELENHNFTLNSLWVNIRMAKNKSDGVALDQIQYAYNKEYVDPKDNSINTVAMGWCVVEYNLKKINSIPGNITNKHLHEFRVIAKSKPVGGGQYLDSIALTVYVSNSAGINDPEQLNIRIEEDTPGDKVVIQRLAEPTL